MDNYIWTLYNKETQQFGNGQLVYQKKIMDCIMTLKLNSR